MTPFEIKNRAVWGVVGEASTGKGEVVKALIKRGFEPFSLSDLIRETLSSVSLPHDRELMIQLGNCLREIFGNDILARGIQRRIENSNSQRVVVESNSNPGEIVQLRSTWDAYIVGVTRSPEKKLA